MGKNIFDDKAKWIYASDLVSRDSDVVIDAHLLKVMKAKDGSGLFIVSNGVVLAYSPNDKHSPDGEYSSIQINFGDYQLEEGLRRQDRFINTFIDCLQRRISTFGHFKKGDFDSWSLVPHAEVPF